MKKNDIMIDLRETARNIKLQTGLDVRYKNYWLIRLGIFFIRFGAFLSGIEHEHQEVGSITFEEEDHE